MHMYNRKAGTVLATAALAALLAGCGGGSGNGSDSASPSPSSSSSSSGSASASPSPSSSSPSSASPSEKPSSSPSASQSAGANGQDRAAKPGQGGGAATGAVRECAAIAGQIKASAAVAGGSGGMGGYGLVLTVRNTSSQPCTLTGYPGVQAAVADAGPARPLGAPAERTGPRRVVTVPAGGTAQAQIRVSQVGKYPAATCKPVRGNTLNVYLPAVQAGVQKAPIAAPVSGGPLTVCGSQQSVLKATSFGAQ